MSKAIVLQNSVLGDVTTITLQVVGGVAVKETAAYSIRDAGSNVVKSGTVSFTPDAGTTTALLLHITTVVLPKIDTQEGT